MVADFGILVAADQAPSHTLPNSTSTQSHGAEAEHKHKHADVGEAALVALHPQMIPPAGSKEVPLPILGHFCFASGAKGDLPLTVP